MSEPENMMADGNSNISNGGGTGGWNGRRGSGIARWSVRAKIVTAFLVLLTTAAGAVVIFEDYLPVLKYQAVKIVDERNTAQTEQIQRSITRSIVIPLQKVTTDVQSVTSDVQKLLRESVIERCNSAKRDHERLDGRLFDLERLLPNATTSDVRLELEYRIRQTRIAVGVAEEKARATRNEMQAAIGRSC